MHLPRFVWPLLPLLLHIGLGLYYRWTGRVAMTGGAEGWDWLWQVLDAQLLRQGLWQNLWDLHMQPPLYNLYGAFFIHLQPNNFLSLVHYANLLAGGLLSAMGFALAYTLTRSRLYASLVACAVALNPALCLYAAHPLYTIFTAFLLTLAAFWLARYQRGRRVTALYGFVATLCALLLTRSAYHLFLLVPALALVWLLTRPHAVRPLLFSLLLSALPFGWYAKNAIRFETFSASSWFGYSLFKIASADYSNEEIYDLAWNQGLLGRPFQDYPDLYFNQPYDFLALYPTHIPMRAEPTGHPALDGDDPNNINIPAIARMYGDNARALIRHAPRRYLASVGRAYNIYTRPSTQFGEIWSNAQNIARHENFSSRYVQGQAFAEWLNKQVGQEIISSFWSFLLPASVLGLWGAAAWRNRLRWAGWASWLRAEPLMASLAALFLYAALVGSFLEFGENNRFRAEVEPLMTVYVAAWLWRVSQAGRAIRRAKNHF